MAFAIEVCRRSNMKEDVLHFWFARRAEGARKARLLGCVENDYSMETMTNPQCDPVMLIGEFMISMDKQGVKEYRIREAKLAVLELFEFVQRDKFAGLVASCTSGFLKMVSVTVSSKVRRAARYHDIWPLSVQLQHIQRGAPAERLDRTKLMGRAAALMMIFIPCRPVPMIRMDWSRMRWIEAGNVLVVPTKEKMDKGRGYTELVIRRIESEALCPLCHALLLKQRAEALGTNDSLFCSEDGKPYATLTQPSRLLKQLLDDVGIDRKYPAYSIRHALITALFDAGLNESQVNDYTGLSHNAHTAATSYFHLNSKRVGHAIAAESLSPAAVAGAESVVETDNTEHQAEEMEEYGESDLDVLGVRANARPVSSSL
jgi:integrase